MIKGFLNLPWWFWGVCALVLSVIWVFVWPQEKVLEPGSIRYIAVRWGHSVVWLLMAASFFMRQFLPNWTATADLLAIAGGLVYGAFLVASYVLPSG